MGEDLENIKKFKKRLKSTPTIAPKQSALLNKSYSCQWGGKETLLETPHLTEKKSYKAGLDLQAAVSGELCTTGGMKFPTQRPSVVAKREEDASSLDLIYFDAPLPFVGNQCPCSPASPDELAGQNHNRIPNSLFSRS